MQVIFDKDINSKPIKSWCSNIEDSAKQQITNLSNLPFIFKHVALMPDTHFGKGCPIGSVVATKNVVVPNLVGVDIGCSVTAVKTSLKEKDLSQENIKKIMSNIRETIPFGKGKYPEADIELVEYLQNLEKEIKNESL